MILNNDFLTEEEYYDKLMLDVLDDRRYKTISESVATLLGFSALALLGGFGGALIAKSREKKQGKIKSFFKRLFGKKKEFDFDYNKKRAVVKREQDKAKSAEDKIPEVFRAIRMDDWDEAETLFKNSPYTDNVDVIKAVSMAICDKLGEPPLFVYPQGNEAYFKLKKIVGMRYAKAITQAVIVAMKQNKSYNSIADADIDDV